MPSCNVSQGYNWVDPTKVDPDHSQILNKIKRYYSHSPRTQSKLERISFDFLSNERPSKATNLVFTFAAKLFGHQSKNPNDELQYFWDKIGAVFNNDSKWTRIGVGSFLYWTAAAWPNDIWLCCKTATGKYDHEEEKDITFMTYWINNNFAHPEGTPPPQGTGPLSVAPGKLNLSGLQGAWGARVC